VLDSTRDSTRTGYFWAYIGDRDHPYTVYDYRDSRGREGPAEVLKDYRGYLQTDAYSSYESVVAKSAGRIIPVGCWAHARRNFFDARLNQPREVHYVLGLIAQLYDIEDTIRERSAAERLAARQERSVPVLERLGAFLREHKDGALPKSQYGQVIGYVLNHWDELRRFTEDGHLEIDNVIASYCTSCTGFRFSPRVARRPSLPRIPVKHVLARILIQPMLPVTPDRTDHARAA